MTKYNLGPASPLLMLHLSMFYYNLATPTWGILFVYGEM